MSYPTGDEKKETIEETVQQKIRITITSSKLPNLQRICNGIMQKLSKNNLKVRGPIPMPRRRLRITTRRAPCGNGTETYDHYELRIYKRVIDFVGDSNSVKQVTQIGLEPEVHVEVSVITE